MASAHHSYYNSKHPARPSERMDSYFPPMTKQVESKTRSKMAKSKRSSIDSAFTRPSSHTISAAAFQRHSRAHSEGSGSQEEQSINPIRLTPPQAPFSRLDKSIDTEIHDEFMYTLHGKRASIGSSSSPLRIRTMQATEMKRTPSKIMTSFNSHFSDDSDSSDDDDEEGEDNIEMNFEGESSTSSTSHSSPLQHPVHLSSFTPPKTHDEVESMINNFAILMRSSSQRQRLASVHLDADKSRYKRRLENNARFSTSDDEENRRGRHMTSHWWHEHEEQRSPLGQHIHIHH